MKRGYLLICLLSIFFCSCSTVARYEDTSARQAAVQLKVNEGASEAVQASADAITAKDDNLAYRFDESALQLLGNPARKIDVSKLTLNIKAQDEYFASLEKSNADLLNKNNKLIAEKTDLQKQVISEARQYENEQRKKALWKWLFSLTGIITVGGIIALFVFFPELLPIFSEIAGIIVGTGYRIIKNILSAFAPKPAPLTKTTS